MCHTASVEVVEGDRVERMSKIFCVLLTCVSGFHCLFPELQVPFVDLSRKIKKLLPLFHIISFSSIVHIYIGVNEFRDIIVYRFIYR